MKEKPQNLKYFSFLFALIGLVAALEVVFSWEFNLRSSFQLYSCAYIILGVWGARSAWFASRSVIDVLLSMWAFVAIVCLTHFHGIFANLYQLFAFEMLLLLIGVQTVWFSLSFVKIINHPSQHWWKTPPRIPVDLKAIVRTNAGKSFVAAIHNISKEGFLVGLSGDESEIGLGTGEAIKIHFVIQSSRYVRCLATIVRQQNPLAFGMKITRIDRTSKRHLERFIERAVA